MVASKFGEEWGGDGLLSWVGEFMGVVYVEGIRMGWEDFSKNTQFFVGMGNKVRFWQDGYGDQPFQLAFPRLYGIALNKEASDFNDWDMDEGVNFLHILEAKEVFGFCVFHNSSL